MQADRFTIKAQEAVAAAQRLAASQGNPELAPAHLLVALIGEDEGFAAQLLVKIGADLAAVRKRALAAVEALPSVSGDAPAEQRPAKSLIDTIKRAEREAAAGGDEYISTDHLLLGLADKASGVAELLPARDAIADAVVRGRGPTAFRARTPRTPRRRSRSSAATSPPRPRAASSTRSSAATTRSAA